MAFAKLKAHLRRIGAGTFDALFEALGNICDLFDPQECRNFIKDRRICLKLNAKCFRQHSHNFLFYRIGL